jgi:predicted DNA-binding transcriptional regulator YafY
MDKWGKVILFDRMLHCRKYCIPLKAILEELECSQATFHRIRTFMQTNLGAPIEFDQRYKGYRYKSENGAPFELPGFWLTKKETEALLSFDYALESLQGGFFSDAFAPIKNRFEPLLKTQKIKMVSLRNRMKIIPIQSRSIDETLFKKIAGATVQSRCLYVEHVKLSQNESVKRTISPQTLVRYRDNWYVDAYCHLRKGLRTFALDRLKNVEISKEKFKKVPRQERETFYTTAYGIFTGPAKNTAIINFSATAAKEVAHEQWHPKQQGIWIDKGTYQLKVPYGHSRELIMDVLRWGVDAEVKGPKELRKEIMETIAGMGKKYK